MSTSSGWKPYVLIPIALLAVAGAAWSVYAFTGGSRGEVTSAEQAANTARNRGANGPGANSPGDTEDIDIPGGPAAGEGSGRGRRVASNRTPPAWIEDSVTYREEPADGWNLPEHRDADRAAEALELSAFDFQEQLSAETTLEGVPLSRRAKLAAAWAGFVTPLVGDDVDAFRTHAAGLGIESSGEAGPGALAEDLFATLSPYFVAASVDLGRASPRRPDPADPMAVPRMPNMPNMPGGGGDRGPGIAAMRMRSENNDGSGETVTSDAVVIPLQAVFPEAALAQEAGGTIVEMVTPVRMERSGDAAPDHVTSLIFVYSEQAADWRPLAARLVLLTDRATEVRPSRQGRP